MVHEIFYKRVVWSKISRVYVKEDKMGETLLVTRSESDKHAGTQGTRFSILDNNQPIKFVKEKRVDQSDHVVSLGE